MHDTHNIIDITTIGNSKLQEEPGLNTTETSSGDLSEILRNRRGKKLS